MFVLYILTAVMLAIVGLKLILNAGMMFEAGSYDPDDPSHGPEKGYALMPFEPVPLLVAAVLAGFAYESVIVAALMLGLGMVCIIGSYPLGLAAGAVLRRWRRWRRRVDSPR